MFSNSERSLIEDAVRQAEKKTSGEIVPVIVEESGSYLQVYFISALAGFAAASALVFYHSLGWGAELHLKTMFAEQIGIMLLFGLLPLASPIRRLLISKKKLEEEVSRSALATFMAAGLTNTKDRTGILIYISIFEHQVMIIADKGIHEKLGEKYWQAQVKDIITGIKSGKSVQALSLVIAEMGSKLAKYFPAGRVNKNELSNKLRVGSQLKVKSRK